MQILVRQLTAFKDVEIRGTESRMELGLQNDGECLALAKTLLIAASQLIQNIDDELSVSIDEMVKQV